MAYLNVHPDYFTHPKTVRLTALCGPRSDVMPIRLWSYAAKFHPDDGLFRKHSAAEIEAAARWDGEAGKLVEAMLKVGFLEKVEGGFKLHDWEDHEGHIGMFARRSKAAAKARWSKGSSNASSNAPSNTPDMSVHDSTVPAERKGGAPGGANAPPEPPPAPGKVKKAYEPTTKAGKEALVAIKGCELIQLKDYTIIEDWLLAFPVIDLAAEIRRAEAWLKSNGDRKKNYARYLNNWFGRQMDRPRGGLRAPREVGAAAPKANKY